MVMKSATHPASSRRKQRRMLVLYSLSPVHSFQELTPEDGTPCIYIAFLPTIIKSDERYSPLMASEFYEKDKRLSFITFCKEIPQREGPAASAGSLQWQTGKSPGLLGFPTLAWRGPRGTLLFRNSLLSLRVFPLGTLKPAQPQPSKCSAG